MYLITIFYKKNYKLNIYINQNHEHEIQLYVAIILLEKQFNF